MSRDLMIDIETLDVLPTSTILTIAAQGFDPFSDRLTDVTFYRRIRLESQEDRSVSDSTLEWWGKQDPEVLDEALGDGDDRVDLKDALAELAKIAFHHDRLWANGTTFDMVILEDAMRQNEVTMPWKYWQVCDARTIYKAAKSPRLTNNHNALADCINQIDTLQQALKKLGVTELG